MLRSWRAATGLAGGLATDVANVVFPSECRVCGAPGVELGRVRVCRECLRRAAQPPAEGLCARCGDALGMESARFAAAQGVTDCTACRLAPPEFDRATAGGTFDSEMRELLHHLKFEGGRRLGETVLGESLAAAILLLQAESAAALLVVPVPLFAARERERGFNQAALLAAAALKRVRRQRPAWQLDLRTDVLERIRDTKGMFALDPRQRRRNLKGAFRVRDRAALAGREVLLIDDILTTGATARECARTLRAAGAAKVWVATVARTMAERAGAEEAVARWDASARNDFGWSKGSEAGMSRS